MPLFSTLHVFDTLLMVTGISVALPIGCAVINDGEGDLPTLLKHAGLILALGLPLWWRFKMHRTPGIEDGIFIADFGWVVVSAVSTLPFMLARQHPLTRPAPCGCWTRPGSRPTRWTTPAAPGLNFAPPPVRSPDWDSLSPSTNSQ